MRDGGLPDRRSIDLNSLSAVIKFSETFSRTGANRLNPTTVPIP